MTIASSGALGAVLAFVEGGRDHRGSPPTTSASARCRARARRRARRSAGRRCTSPATSATPRRPPRGTTSSSSSPPRRSRSGRPRAATRRCARTPRRSSRWRRSTPTIPRFRVPYDQVNFAADDFNAVGPVLGPMRQVRQVTAQMMAAIYAGEDVQASLDRRRRAGQPAADRLRQPQLDVLAGKIGPIWGRFVPRAHSGKIRVRV